MSVPGDSGPWNRLLPQPHGFKGFLGPQIAPGRDQGAVPYPKHVAQRLPGRNTAALPVDLRPAERDYRIARVDVANAQQVPLGPQRLDEAVDARVGALNTTFTTWAPGVVGKADLDPILNRVPLLVERAGELSRTLKRGLGIWLTLEDLAAGRGDESAAVQHARLATCDALRFLVAYREFNEERQRYLARLN